MEKSFDRVIFFHFSWFFGDLGIMYSIYWLLRKSSPESIRKIFGKLQIFSAAFMAFSHGSNDGQKFMGAFSLTLVLGGIFHEFNVPIWVILVCAITMGIGTAALAIELASRLGIPLSTTHTINTSIMGVGATRRLSGVRWGVGKEIVTAWVLTFPVCGIIAWTVTKILNFIL